MNDDRPIEPLTTELEARARKALQQGMVMHDAAVIMRAMHEFSLWSLARQNGHGELTRTDVVGFFMTYAKVMIDQQFEESKPPAETPLL